MGIGLELELGFRPMGSCRFMPLAASRVGSSTAREGVGTPRSLADGRATTCVGGGGHLGNSDLGVKAALIMLMLK